MIGLRVDDPKSMCRCGHTKEYHRFPYHESCAECECEKFMNVVIDGE